MKLTYTVDESGRIIPTDDKGQPIEGVTFSSVECETGQPPKLSLIVTIDHANKAPDIQTARCKS